MLIGITTSLQVFGCCYKMPDIRAGFHDNLIQLKFNPKYCSKIIHTCLYQLSGIIKQNT